MINKNRNKSLLKNEREFLNVSGLKYPKIAVKNKAKAKKILIFPGAISWFLIKRYDKTRSSKETLIKIINWSGIAELLNGG